MRHELSLVVGSRDELAGWILIERDTIYVQIGSDSTVICMAQSPTLASTLIDHAMPVALHLKIIAQRLSKFNPGKQVFVCTDQVEEESTLFWEEICRQLKQKLEEVKAAEQAPPIS